MLCATASMAGDRCDAQRGFQRPQPVYTSLEEKVDLHVAHIPHRPQKGSVVAPDGNYTFVELLSDNGSSVRIWPGGPTDLSLTVADSGRPMTAKWINAKLLIVEISINPHAGFYWIFDVERGKVLWSEGEIDGNQWWTQCKGKPYEQ